MEINPLNRNLPTQVTNYSPSQETAEQEIRAKVAETAKVTPAPSPGDAGPQGGSSGQPGLGEKVDIYDTEAARVAAEKAATEKAALAHSQDKESTKNKTDKNHQAKPKSNLHLLGKGEGLPNPADIPEEPKFPFLVPLGSQSLQAKPGKVIDTTG